jgi:hypothetical protein
MALFFHTISQFIMHSPTGHYYVYFIVALSTAGIVEVQGVFLLYPCALHL